MGGEQEPRNDAKIVGPLRANIETLVANLLDAGEVPVVIISHVPGGKHPTVTTHPGLGNDAVRLLLEAAHAKLSDDVVPDSLVATTDPDET